MPVGGGCLSALADKVPLRILLFVCLLQVQNPAVVAAKVARLYCALRVCIDTNLVCTVALRNFVEAKQEACVSERLDSLATAQDCVERLAAV